MKSSLVVGLAAFCLLAQEAPARDVAGVNVPDTVTLEGKTLVLNGVGLREYSILRVDIYVGALYVESRSDRADVLVAPEAWKRMDMRFVKAVGRESLAKAWTEGFEKNSPDLLPKVKPGLAALAAAMSDVAPGDVVSLAYVPDRGTTVTVKGKQAATIEGADFARALFRCWLGPNPPTEDLKRGLLGIRD